MGGAGRGGRCRHGVASSHLRSRHEACWDGEIGLAYTGHLSFETRGPSGQEGRAHWSWPPCPPLRIKGAGRSCRGDDSGHRRLSYDKGLKDHPSSTSLDMQGN